MKLIKEAINLMKSLGIDGFFTTMEDEHLSEFVSERDNRIRQLTGFTGSAGMAFTSINDRFLMTDGRYHLQARKELKDYELLDESELPTKIKSLRKVSIDTRYISYGRYNKLKNTLAENKIELVHVEDIVFTLWKDRPMRKIKEVIDLEKFSYENKVDFDQIEKQLFECSTSIINTNLNALTKQQNISVINSSQNALTIDSGQKTSIIDGNQNTLTIDSNQNIFTTDSSRNTSVNSSQNTLTKEQKISIDEHKLREMLFFNPVVNNNSNGTNITGSFRKSKIDATRNILNMDEILIITELDTIAWLLNLRGQDLPNNLLFYSFLVITPDKATLFTDSSIDESSIFTVKKYDDFYSELDSSQKVVISGDCSAFIANKFNKKRFTSKIRKLQSIKNEMELYGMLRSCLYDSIALMKLFELITPTRQKYHPNKQNQKEKDNINQEKYNINQEKYNINQKKDNMNKQQHNINNKYQFTEKDVADLLVKIKKDIPYFLVPSFDSVVATGENGAELHHRSKDEVIKHNEMILIDSGSHYLFGTTDITRTLNDNPTDEMKKEYTLVLKSNLAPRLMKESKITGRLVDSQSRDLLRREGYEYDSATGHGVGFGLNVHEGPPFIGHGGKRIVENQVFTIEPGIYISGKYGIRIEDVVFLRQRNVNHNIGDLSYVPYHSKLIDSNMLTREEKQYLNEFNRKIKCIFNSILREDEGLNYFQENTTEYLL